MPVGSNIAVKLIRSSAVTLIRSLGSSMLGSRSLTVPDCWRCPQTRAGGLQDLAPLKALSPMGNGKSPGVPVRYCHWPNFLVVWASRSFLPAQGCVGIALDGSWVAPGSRRLPLGCASGGQAAHPARRNG